MVSPLAAVNAREALGHIGPRAGAAPRDRNRVGGRPPGRALARRHADLKDLLPHPAGADPFERGADTGVRELACQRSEIVVGNILTRPIA